jgi:omega-hydroxy-beta-dihydromenaquinone-9 sulfotransferase
MSIETAPLRVPVAETPPPATPFHNYPPFAPRFWHGMTTPVAWRLLRHGRTIPDLQRWPLAAGVSLLSLGNSLLALCQHLLHGRQIAAQKIPEPPLFIIGHWRSGTTMLHEWLNLDPQFASPTTYQCFAPWHFLLTEGMVQRFGRFLLPKHRPMDNMAAGWHLPQEDEFALMNLGSPSPYRRIAFPRRPPPDMELLDMPPDLDRRQREHWCRSMLWFAKALTYHANRRLLLKSPTHTGRLHILRQLFPGAKFVHITRDPRNLFPSTVRLWQALDSIQGLQVPSPEPGPLEQYVLECLPRMYAAFEKHRVDVPADSLVDVRYEDLVVDPVGQVQRIYRQLQLDGFEQLLPQLQAAQQAAEDYRTNRHRIAPQQLTQVMSAWHDYASQYGYLDEPDDRSSTP